MTSCMRSLPIASTSKCILPPLSRQASTQAKPPTKTNADFLAKAVRKAAEDIDITTPVRVVNERNRQHMLVQSLGSLGSTQTAQTGYKPRHALIRPLAPNQVALDHILASSLHLGHRSIFYNRHASPHIYGRRHKTDIIDARQTLAHLRRAAEVVRGVVEHDGVVVFMSALKGTERAVLDAASACGPNGFAVTTYKQGFLLNAEVVYDGYDFSDLRTGARGRASAADDKVTPGMLMPSLLVVLTPRSHLDAIAEANIIRCPTMGLVDSDTDPRIVTYSIPGNDDGVRGIQLVAGVLGQAGKDGLQRRQQRRERPNLPNAVEAESRAQERRLIESKAAEQKARSMRFGGGARARAY